MLKRGLAFCLVLSAASVARAGATIDLKPTTGLHNDAGNSVCFELGTVAALVDVHLQQTPAGTARELRHLQLDFSASELCPSSSSCPAGLFLVPQATHGTDRLWYFGGEPTCLSDADDTCGDGHFFETSFTQPAGREKVVSMTWYFVTPTDLNGDAAYQRTLPASAAVKVAQLRVELPTTAGEYTLDAINAAQTNADLGGADIRFGFGVDVAGGDGVALTTWRANLAAPNNITGSPLTITMAANCGVPPTGACCRANATCQTGQLQSACSAPGETWQGAGTNTCSNCVAGACCVSGTTCEQTLTQAGCQARPGPGVWQGAGTTTCTTGGCVGGTCTISVTSSSPNDQGSLWRSERNIFYLTFNAAVALPPAGALKIEKITGGTTPSCTFGADLTPLFTTTLTNTVPPAPAGAANTVLQVRENAAVAPATSGPLEHRTWYRVSYTGTNWGAGSVCKFSREFVVQQGDADGNRFVTSVDVGIVNSSPSGVAPINSRNDIDGNGFRTAVDVGQANAGQGAGIPAKPCDPPAVVP